MRGEVSSPRLSPAHSPAEVLSHARPPRRTRTSVRPAECRVSDRTVVRLENAIRACSGSPGTGSPNERGTMRKKTAPPRQEHPKASATERSGPNQTSGLIAKGEQGGRSARRSPTLDDRSHRTRRRAERGGRLPGRAAFILEPSVPRPDPPFMMNGVSSGGIPAHPAVEPAGRGRLHPANADSPGSNHHITGSLNTPRSLRSARDPEPPSALSETPRSPRLRVSPMLRVSV